MSITNKEKVRRLHEISKLLEKNKTDSEIADELGMSIMAVKRNITYLEDLKKADITPEETAEKRSELYLKLLDAEAEAKKLFDMYKTPFTCPKCNGLGRITEEKKDKDGNVTKKTDVCPNCKGLGALQKTVDVERFHKAWLRTIEQMAKLYGLDSVKPLVTMYNQFNQGIPKVKDTIPAATRQKLAKAIIEAHEKKVSNES